LSPAAPAIDAGDNTGAPQWDQRGRHFPRIENGIIDIGAFEYAFPPNRQPLPDPVPVQAMPSVNGPLFGLPPALPAESSPLPGPGIPDGHGQQVPAATAGEGQPAETFLAINPVDDPARAPLGLWAVGQFDPLALEPIGGWR
jgi:hypothetical protein